MPRQSKYWVFTMNNYTDAHVAHLRELGASDRIHTLVFGREVGESGTPHLQGFVHWTVGKRLQTTKTALGSDRVHVEPARGTPYQAYEYFTKDGDFESFGEVPINVAARTGTRGQFVEYIQWVTDHYNTNGRPPSEREISQAHPHLFVRYRRNLAALTEFAVPQPDLQQGELRDWQIALNNRLHDEPDDRTVEFVVDYEGGKGKSFFMRWFFTNNERMTQLLSIGKRDDLAHCIDRHKSVFLFDIPRGSMEHLQYCILEKLKDKVIHSPKYDSHTKLLFSNCHVVVFCNEDPDLNKMSADRYVVTRI